MELSEMLSEFQEKYPNVRFDIAGDIVYRIEQGFLDLGLMFDYVNKEKYKFIWLKKQEEWRILIKKDHHLAQKENVFPEDIKKLPIIITQNLLIQNELANWIGISTGKLNIKSTFTLIYNAAMMVRNNMGAAVCLRLENNFEDLKFILFYNSAPSRIILAWKPHPKYSAAIREFIKLIEEKRNSDKEYY